MSQKGLVVGHRLSLPLDGSAIDLAPLSGTPGSVRIVITGTLSSTLDGSRIDAFARESAGTRYDSEGPFVILPAGATIVSEDRALHRYIVDVPRAASMPIAISAAPLASRHLVTPSEARRSLNGAIEIDVLDLPPPIAAVVATHAARLPAPVLAGAGLAVLGSFALCTMVLHRRNREELRLERRAHAAARRVRQEARLLGPAFETVEESCTKLLEATVLLRRHVEEIAAASRRIGSLRAPGAAEKRRELDDKRTDSLRRLRALVERLEGATADLAARGPDPQGAKAFDDAFADLDRDLGSATRAHDELRAL